eukprot:GHVO01039039.1.p1 GENE.GHVO01039039.1~~GHVO01039039.1.p1  ORF type:complete len:387 (-),score=65.72 GHVO01039039.1:161-1246(-)
MRARAQTLHAPVPKWVSMLSSDGKGEPNPRPDNSRSLKGHPTFDRYVPIFESVKLGHVESTSYRIGVVSDFGWSWGKTAATPELGDIDCLAFMGDLTSISQGVKNRIARMSQYKKLHDTMQQTYKGEIPIFVLPGEKEIGQGGRLREFENEFGPSYFNYVDHKACNVFVNSSVILSTRTTHPHLNNQRSHFQWLQYTLEKCKQLGLPTLIFSYHSLAPTNRPPNIQDTNRNLVYDLLVSYGVQFVVSSRSPRDHSNVPAPTHSNVPTPIATSKVPSDSRLDGSSFRPPTTMSQPPPTPPVSQPPLVSQTPLVTYTPIPGTDRHMMHISLENCNEVLSVTVTTSHSRGGKARRWMEVNSKFL